MLEKRLISCTQIYCCLVPILLIFSKEKKGKYYVISRKRTDFFKKFQSFLNNHYRFVCSLQERKKDLQETALVTQIM